MKIGELLCAELKSHINFVSVTFENLFILIVKI